MSSQKVRKRVESIFGWIKTVGGFRRSRYVGLERTGLCGELVTTAYNLVWSRCACQNPVGSLRLPGAEKSPERWLYAANVPSTPV